MTDLDDIQGYEDDDWGEEYDDLRDDYLAWIKDEPDCYACNDTGNVIVDYDRDPPKYRSCPSCGPNWPRRMWWRVTDPILGRWLAWRSRRRAPGVDDDLPF